MSQDVMLCVMNSTAIFGDSVILEMQSSESCDKCSDLDAELLKKQNAYNNDVVERRNWTLVEAARTMLIFSKAPLFLWAEAINTACYTQNRSLIRLRYNKTPYELMHEKKTDLSFLHIFGSLCYLTNDSEDLGKLNPKADIVQVAATPRAVDIADSPVSTTIDQDAPSTNSTSQGSPSNVWPSHTPFKLLGKWTKNHPIANVIRDPSRLVSIRKQLQTDVMWCYFDAFLTSVELKTYKEAMLEPSWIGAMQEEIHEFERLQNATTEVPPLSSSHFVSSTYTNAFLNLENLHSTETEVVSTLNINLIRSLSHAMHIVILDKSIISLDRERNADKYEASNILRCLNPTSVGRKSIWRNLLSKIRSNGYGMLQIVLGFCSIEDHGESNKREVFTDGKASLREVAERMNMLTGMKDPATASLSRMATRVFKNPSLELYTLSVQVISSMRIHHDVVSSSLHLPSVPGTANVVDLFGVPLNTLGDINKLTKDIELGKYEVWSDLPSGKRMEVLDYAHVIINNIRMDTCEPMGSHTYT
ncbi:retrovirus-related pol polyprotein from transposon TNT 1-94 [Tanacetum coccineum]